MTNDDRSPTSTTLDDGQAMQIAIDASAAALAAGNMPFGAVLVSPAGELLHVAGNNQVTSGDFGGHAEMVLLREAATRLGRDALKGCTVYASGEPCAMCSGGLYWAGIERLVWAASTADIAECLGGDTLAITSREVLGTASRPLRIDGPLMGEAAVAVLRRQV